MKRKNAGFGAALAAALAMLSAPPASAAPTASLQVRVTVNVSLSVSLGGATDYDFGLINASSVVGSTSAIVVTNDSGGRTEDYTINSSTFMATGGAGWGISGGLNGGADQFSLCARLNSVVVATGTYAAADCFDANAGTSQQMGASNFAGDQNGNNVASAGTRNLWLRFAAPTSMTGGGNVAQAVTVTVTANDASTF